MDKNHKQKTHRNLLIIKGLLEKYRKEELLEKDTTGFNRLHYSKSRQIKYTLQNASFLTHIKKFFHSLFKRAKNNN